MNHVARIDLAQPHAPGEGRGDTREGQLQPHILDRGLVGAHRALELLHGEALRIDRLAGDGILREEPPVALEVDARARALRLILRELSLGWSSAAWNVLGSICASRSPPFTSCPSRK